MFWPQSWYFPALGGGRASLVRRGLCGMAPVSPPLSEQGQDGLGLWLRQGSLATEGKWCSGKGPGL